MLEVSLYGMEEILAKLRAIQERSGNLRPALLEIGDFLTEETKRRFITATAPDGSQWIKNSDVTLAHKSGSTPLTDSGELAATHINCDLIDNDNGVEIGSNADQAAMMQFGGTKAEFPHLWGDIPARPFLGISDNEKETISNMLDVYLL